MGMCHYGHGSGYDTTVGEPVFRTDDAFHIESGGTDSILFAHFLSQLRRSLQRKAFRHGNDNLPHGEGTGRWAYGRGEDLFRETFTETIVAILRCDGFPSGFCSSATGSLTSDGDSKQMLSWPASSGR